MCQVNRVSPDLRRALFQRSLAPFSDGIFSRRACLARLSAPRSCFNVGKSYISPPWQRWRRAGTPKCCGAAINPNRALLLCSTAGHSFSSSVPLFILRLCLLLVFTAGGRLAGSGTRERLFFFSFCNKGIILDHTARAARRDGDDFSAAALQQSNFL